MRGFIYFCCHFNVPDFPLELGILLRYLAFLGRGPNVYNSASNIVSSLRWFCKFLDPPSASVFDSPYVVAALKGMKSQLSRPPHQKLPFSLSHMAAIYEVLDFSLLKHVTAWAAMLLAFFGCLRLSNLVPPSKRNYDPMKQLSASDVIFIRNLC